MSLAQSRHHRPSPFFFPLYRQGFFSQDYDEFEDCVQLNEDLDDGHNVFEDISDFFTSVVGIIVAVIGSILLFVIVTIILCCCGFCGCLGLSQLSIFNKSKSS